MYKHPRVFVNLKGFAAKPQRFYLQKSRNKIKKATWKKQKVYIEWGKKTL